VKRPFTALHCTRVLYGDTKLWLYVWRTNCNYRMVLQAIPVRRWALLVDKYAKRSIQVQVLRVYHGDDIYFVLRAPRLGVRSARMTKLCPLWCQGYGFNQIFGLPVQLSFALRSCVT
jgi:hypothetical protein